MNTIAFKMHLKPGCKSVYKQRHDEIWPELRNLLKKEGIIDYYIFLDEGTNTLFGIQQQPPDHSSRRLSQHRIMQLWWKYMADIMETNPDNSPITVLLEEVFHLE